MKQFIFPIIFFVVFILIDFTQRFGLAEFMYINYLCLTPERFKKIAELSKGGLAFFDPNPGKDPRDAYSPYSIS